VIPGRFVRARGSNLREGDPVLPPGTPITPGALGTLATFGLTRPSVYRQVRVAVVVTGDEVVAAFRRPAPAQIRDANGWIMEGFVRGLPWATLLSRTHAPDRVMPGVDPLREALRTGLDTADVLLVSGGVSAGHDDRVRPLLEGLGVRVLFHGVRSRPGRPLLAGVRGEGGTVVLGLPGNPVSVLACLRRFGLPLLRRRAGWATPVPPVGQLPLSAPVEADPILDRLLPAELDPDAGEAPRLRLVPFTGSGDLGAAARADGLVEIPAGAAGVGPFAFHSWTP
ncbi:MAG: molybdopterin molybdenumtransferase MoeA, partial [Gemmatimonadales bacterium]